MGDCVYVVMFDGDRPSWASLSRTAAIKGVERYLEQSGYATEKLSELKWRFDRHSTIEIVVVMLED